MDNTLKKWFTHLCIYAAVLPHRSFVYRGKLAITHLQVTSVAAAVVALANHTAVEYSAFASAFASGSLVFRGDEGEVDADKVPAHNTKN